MPPITRDKIIEAAMELFTLQGYAATGLAQIAKHAGCNPGSVYYFFPTKEEILAATLVRRKETLGSDVLDPIWEGVSDPLERIFALLGGYRRMLQMTEFAHGCPIGNLVIEVAETNKHARKLLCENFDGWLKAVERCFAAAIESGRIPEDCEPRTLSIFVLTTMEGAVMLARSYRDFRAYDAAVTALRDYIGRLERAASGWERPADTDAITESRIRSPSPRSPTNRRRRKR